jgi:molybdopterin-guanine dinucleotide biosynthesis protein A
MTAGIILAGGKKENLLEGGNLPENEALIPIGSRVMVEYIVDAVLGSRYIERIIIAGPRDELKKYFQNHPGIELVESGESPVQSLLKALDCLSPEEYQEKVLVTTGDIPLLTTEAVNGFLESCRGLEGDLFYPIVKKETNENKYPGVQRTYVSLKEGVFTGGNMFLLKPEIMKKCSRFAEELVRLRKKPLSLASYIGWFFLLRYLMGRLSIKDAEDKVLELLGIKGVGIISPFPEIGIDVDKTSDLELVQKVLCS